MFIVLTPEAHFDNFSLWDDDGDGVMESLNVLTNRSR